MRLWTRIIALLGALVLGALAAGCGGGSSGPADVPADAIAVVGGREIPKTDYDRLLARAEQTYKARKQDFPKAGTAEFAQLRNAIVKSLVEQTEFEIAADELGIVVTDEEVDKRLDQLKQQYFQGDEQRYRDELEKQGITEEQVRDDVRTRILSEKTFEGVTKNVQVTDADLQTYYEQNKAQFETPATREVRHILVKSEARANEIYQQLKNGADFATLAKKYSQDPSSKEQGGKFTAQQGATVPQFDKVAFSLKTGELSKPVKTQFGWHVIMAISDVTPKKTKPLSEVEDQIRQQLLEQKRNERINDWIAQLRERFADQISYAPGFQPPPETTATSTGASTSPTGTGSQ
jgi:peptidyl-prolyl cis-trans isomerase C